MAIDDLNDWVGCLGGHPNALTPNIDAMASRGVLFEKAYCPSTLCKPSRASVFSGLLPSTLGIYENGQRWRSALADDQVPLPERFMELGYEGLGAGKIYHGVTGRRWEAVSQLPWPVARPAMRERWGDWDDFIPDPPNPVPDVLPGSGLAGATRWFDWGPVDVEDSEMGDAQVASWTSAQLARKHDRPFFMACGFYRPHLPWYAPRRYFDLYRDVDVALPEVDAGDLADLPATPRRWTQRLQRQLIFQTLEDQRSAVTAYLACTSFVDACVGRVLAALANGPNAEDTIVVLWSDHGHHLGEKQMWDKRVLWEETTHVPLIVAAPGVNPGVCSQAVGLVDVYPTLLELCSLSPASELDGQSLLPFLRDPQAVRAEPVLTTFQFRNHSLRSERWRYTQYRDGGEELYDHDRDPGERHNLSDDPSLASVKGELARWMPKLNRPRLRT